MITHFGWDWISEDPACSRQLEEERRAARDWDKERNLQLLQETTQKVSGNAMEISLAHCHLPLALTH